MLLGKNSGVGSVLDNLGVSLIFTWAGVVIAATVVSFPLVYKTVLSAFEQIDPNQIDAARSLGASEWQIFGQILLPLSRSGILAGSILAFARALGEFGATLMVGGTIPGATQTIPIAIFFAAEAGQMRMAGAWVLLMVVVSLTVMAAINYNSSPKGDCLLSKIWFNWFYFAHLTRKLPTVHQSKANSGRSIHRVNSELLVKLNKTLPRFSLNLDFEIAQTPLGIIGPSGSGKSMTLRCIAGLETPDRGSIVLNGRVLFDAQKGVNVRSCDRRVGLLFQNYALFPHLSVAQNIAFGMQHIPRHQRLEKVVAYLKQMELEGLHNRYPHQLSGGQQQRVALARVLASEPDVLLLDEPLSALDTYLRSNVERLLRRQLAEYPGVSVFVTHKLEEAYRVCPNLLVLAEGGAIAQGTQKEIFEHPANRLTAQITECKNFSRAQKIEPRHVEASDWNCQLEVSGHLPDKTQYVGIRAHHIQFPVQFSASIEQSNTFLGWVAAVSETQHRVTLYIKLHSEPTDAQDYHLQAEVYREKWAQLSQQPLYVRLAPHRLIAMSH